MLTRLTPARGATAAAFVVTLLGWACLAVGEDKVAKGNFQVHDISVWLAEPNAKQANGRNQYPSLFPGLVETSRNRAPLRGQDAVSPLGLLTFYGRPLDDLEVELRVAKSTRDGGTMTGQFLAHWPTAEARSGQLRWKELKLFAEVNESAAFGEVADEHWFKQARQIPALYARDGSRTERFLAYDVELPYEVPIKLEGGPDKYTVVNAGDTPLYDVLIVRPTNDGHRVGWLDVIPAAEHVAGGAEEKFATAGTQAPSPATAEELQKAAKAKAAAALAAAAVPEATGRPVIQAQAANAEKKPSAAATPQPTSRPTSASVVVGPPLASGSAELAEQTTKALTKRLKKAGLTDAECELFLNNYRTAIFQSEKLVVLYRVPGSVVEDSLSLSCYPEASEVVRVGLVLVRNIDPALGGEIDKLIADLGDAAWSRREAAQQRLADLGPLAVPALKRALANPDLEIVIRAERILLAQNESIETPAQAAANALNPAVQGIIQWFAK